MKRWLVLVVGFLSLIGLLICINVSLNNDVEIEDAALKWKVNETGGITIIGTQDASLQEVTIPARISGRVVTEIAENAFADCHNLSRIEIPATVVAIGEQAFRDCDCVTIVAASGTYAEEYALCHGMEFRIRERLCSISGKQMIIEVAREGRSNVL